MFFFQNVIEHITKETNASIILIDPNLSTSSFEIKKFIAITLYMGINKLPNLKMYWEKGKSNDRFHFKNSFVVNTLSYARYTFLRSHFRLTFFADKEDNNKQLIIEKTSRIIGAINKLFRSVYVPSQKICIDEATIPFKGRCGAKVYNPQKPDKWGLKLYELCDSKNKYVYSIKFWNGKSTSLIDTVKFLLSGLEFCNYHLYMDNLYNSFENSLNLLNVNVYVTGTLRKRRGGPLFMNLSRIKGVAKNSIFPFTKDKVNVIVYYDTKVVTMISTFYDLSNDDLKSTLTVTPNNVKVQGYAVGGRPYLIKIIINTWGQ